MDSVKGRLKERLRSLLVLTELPGWHESPDGLAFDFTPRIPPGCAEFCFAVRLRADSAVSAGTLG